MLHAAANDEAVRDGEDVGHTITRVDDCPCEVALPDVLAWAGNLRVESQRGLDTNKEALNVEGLKHDLCHLLSVLRGVQGRLRQDEAVLLRLASQLGVDGAVPELLHGFPVLDLATSYYILQVV